MARRAALVLGLLLVTFGVLAAAGILKYDASRQVVDFGVGRSEAVIRKGYPPWLGVAAVMAGLVVMVGAARAGRQTEYPPVQ